MLDGRMHIVSYCEFLTLDVSSASYLCDVHNAVCSDRGQRWLSDQREHVPNDREERETAREGTREPVNKTARDRDPEPVNKGEQCQQQVKFAKQHVEVQHVEKNGTQCFKSASQRQLDNKFDRDESNVIINTDQKGSCPSPRQKISETRMKPISRRSRPSGLDNLKRMSEIPVPCSMTN